MPISDHPLAKIYNAIDARGDHTWTVVSRNGNPISRSTEGYRKESGRDRSKELTLLALLDWADDDLLTELGVKRSR